MMGGNEITMMEVLGNRYLLIIHLHYVILLSLLEIEFIVKHIALSKYIDFHGLCAYST